MQATSFERTRFPAENSNDSTQTRVRRLWSREEGSLVDEDELVVEEPLEIRWGNLPLAVLMRTPGHDLELATGFALTELLAQSPADIMRVSHCSEGDHGENVVRITPAPHVSLDPALFQRNLFTASSCGICGKKSIERALAEAPPLAGGPLFSATLLATLPAALREKQRIFERTGALHAAALADTSGTLTCVREDIGRHNAVDKVVGWAARVGFPLHEQCWVLSGRASYEIVQKSLAAGVSCVVAVGGVSSLAVDLAERAGIVLCGFARGGRLSVYAGSERVA
jgi:FdhD protein